MVSHDAAYIYLDANSPISTVVCESNMISLIRYLAVICPALYAWRSIYTAALFVPIRPIYASWFFWTSVCELPNITLHMGWAYRSGIASRSILGWGNQSGQWVELQRLFQTPGLKSDTSKSCLEFIFCRKYPCSDRRW